jgi:hypothetical protein
MSTDLIFRTAAFRFDIEAGRRAIESRCGSNGYRRDFEECAYLYFEEVGANNTIDHNGRIARSWQLRSFGSKYDHIDRAAQAATDFEGGMARFANSRHTSPEGYIAAVRRTLVNAPLLPAFPGELVLSLDPTVTEARPVDGAPGDFTNDVELVSGDPGRNVQALAWVRHPWRRVLEEAGRFAREVNPTRRWNPAPQPLLRLDLEASEQTLADLVFLCDVGLKVDLAYGLDAPDLIPRLTRWAEDLGAPRAHAR